MAIGIDKFSEHFNGFEDQYVVIGGMACDLLMEEAGLDFRLTKDVDIVLIVEALTDDFARKFWEFIEMGGYKARRRESGKSEFYRFVDPEEAGYPSMIELFARPENAVDFEYKGHLVQIHLGEEISSLSAILLNDDYYRFILNGRIVIDSVVVLDAAHIVPLKMKAWLDLQKEITSGRHVNDRDLRKHRQDVFRLFPVVDTAKPVYVEETIFKEITEFLEKMKTLEVNLKAIGITLDKNTILKEYAKLYLLKEE